MSEAFLRPLDEVGALGSRDRLWRIATAYSKRLRPGVPSTTLSNGTEQQDSAKIDAWTFSMEDHYLLEHAKKWRDSKPKSPGSLFGSLSYKFPPTLVDSFREFFDEMEQAEPELHAKLWPNKSVFGVGGVGGIGVGAATQRTLLLWVKHCCPGPPPTSGVPVRRTDSLTSLPPPRESEEEQSRRSSTSHHRVLRAQANQEGSLVVGKKENVARAFES